MCFEISADSYTRLVGAVNGKRIDIPITDLLHGPRAEYLGGFLTPAFYFHRAVRQSEYTTRLQFDHIAQSNKRDWYHVRVRQNNGHWAWSSPLWIEPSHD